MLAGSFQEPHFARRQCVTDPVLGSHTHSDQFQFGQRNSTVRRVANAIGSTVAELRYQRGWTKDELVAKMQILGCCITRDVLANIETRRSICTDLQIDYFAQVFGVEVKEFFTKPCANSRRPIVGLAATILTRQRCPRSNST